jgi:squalene-associated FAD-dependent desaturase
MDGAGTPQVAVVGGGLAGVAAALDAADAGASVVLLERRKALGGLTWSFERRGRRFDNGQHVFLRCCDAYREFLDRIGAAGDVVLQDRLSVPVLAPGGRQATIGRSGLPAPLHPAGAEARYRHLSGGDRLRLGPAVAALRRLDPADPRLDDMTFGEWLARHHQSPRSIAVLWDLIILPTVNVPAAQASLAMAVKVFRTGLLDTASGGDIGWAAVPLGDLHGRRAAAALEAAGVTVHTGVQVTAIDPTRGGGWSIAGGEPLGRLTAEAVVLATPPAVAAALAPPRSLPEVDRLGHSPVVDVQLVLDRRVTDLTFLAAVDSPIQFVFDRTAVTGLSGDRGQCLALSLSGADAYVGVRPETLVTDFMGHLRSLLPAAAQAQVVDAVVTKEQAATFRAVPGTAALRPVPGLVAESMAVAGAWCATGWPATREGAIRSGRQAAQQQV